jgi:peptidyl-prolyl cis-trans isomerase D
MAKKPTQKIVTKKHLARMERERIQNRNILIAGITIFVLVFGIIGYGILDQLVLKNIQPVAKVGSETIGLGNFYSQVRYQRNSLVSSFRQYTQYLQMFGSNQSFTQAMQQIQTQLSDATGLGQTVLDQMIDDVLIRQYATKNNITVTRQEVDKAFQEAFGYFQNGTPSPTGTATEASTSTLSAYQQVLVATPFLSLTQLAELSATPTATVTPTGTITPPPPTNTLAPTATITPTQTLTPTGPINSATPTTGPSLTPTVVPSATLSPTPYTLAGYQNEVKTAVAGFKSSINIGENELRKIIENSLYRKKVMDKVLEGLKAEEEQVWARHILVKDEATAKDILQRIQNGESFFFLANKYSTDTGSAINGGDVGWFGKGKMVPEFETAAFALNVGEISQPIASQFGFHIIQVLGHENRPLAEADFSTYRQTKFTDWLKSYRTENSKTIQQFSIWSNEVPKAPDLTAEDLQSLQQ